MSSAGRMGARWLFLAAGALSCGSAPLPKSIATDLTDVLPDLALQGTDGAVHAVRREAGEAAATVFEFFSSNCPVQSAHDARLVALAQSAASRGVRVFAVDSEVGGSPERDSAEAKARGYPFPILLDADGALAKATGARYATFTVAVDPRARVRYRGGLDSDRQRLHEDAQLYVVDAVAQLLAGHDPDPAETQCLGCYLRRW